MTATHGEGAYGNAVGVTTPTDHKMAQVAEFVKTGVNTIRPGLLWDGNATIVTGKASMGLDIRAFSIVTSRSATLGAIKWANDATVTLTKDVNGTNLAAPGSNSVYWNVFAWHREYSIDGTDSNPIIAILVGTSAASPTVPALTSYPGAVSLATVLVPAGTTATNSGTTITQTAPFTTVDGGVVVARTTTERDAYTPASTDTKARCWVIADGITYRWNGSSWGLPSTSGSVSLGTNYSQSSGILNQLRFREGQVTLVLALDKSSTAVANGDTPATLPSGFRPPSLMVAYGVSTSTGTLMTFTISTAGVITVFGGGGSATNLRLNVTFETV